MPLYEYECSKCRHRFEKIEPVSASETKKCPKCGANAERLLAPPAIQFKGSGWYVTDYAGKRSEAPTEKADGKSAKETTSSKESTPAKDSAQAKESSSAEGKSGKKSSA